MPEAASPPPLAVVRGFPAAAGAVDLEVHPGDIVLLRGGNGSGKTSLLRSLAGLDAPLRPTSLEVNGLDPRATPANALQATLVAQDPRDGLTGLTVQGEADLHRVPLPASIEDFAQREVAGLSAGEARRVALALAVAQARPLFLLDEPVEGLDAAGRAMLLHLVRAKAQRGAVVVSDHSGTLASVATRVVDLGATTPPARVHLPEPGPSVPIPPQRVRRGARLLALPGFTASGLTAITGANGAGKSTLLLALAGLLGTQPLPGAPRLLLPQAHAMLWRERVAHHLGTCDATVRQRLVLPILHGRSPLALSGGEAQRVALASILGTASPVYLLDEPEAHLDAAGRAAMLTILAQRIAEGSVVLAATHDPELIRLAHQRVEVAA